MNTTTTRKISVYSGAWLALVNSVSVAALLASGLVLLPGCGGGGATFHAASNKTLGQELEDLQRSYEKGILTQKQYEDTKKQLIKNYTK